MSKITILILVAVLGTVGIVKAVNLGSVEEEIIRIENEVNNLLSEPLGEIIESVEETIELAPWQKMMATTIISKGTISKKIITTAIKELADGSTTTIKTGAKVDFTYREETETASITADGYNNCRRGMWGTTTKEYCDQRTRHQINEKIKLKEEAIDQRIKEAGYLDYTDELISEGL